jgi:hypothetical protein
MKVTVKARTLLHDKLGRLREGQVVELPEAQAREFLRRGFVEHYDTKVLQTNPQPPVGEEQLPSVSPAGQASPSKTSSGSGRGKKKILNTDSSS